MGYRKIPNLYRPEIADILEEPQLYAMEKIHGTSAHIKYHNGKLTFHSGGANHQEFVKLFDPTRLENNLLGMLREPGCTWDSVVIYGEAYGGKMNAQAWRYGKPLRFVAFDVCLVDGFEAETWLTVPDADLFVKDLELEFVHYEVVSSKLVDLDAARDKPSTQAKRNGIEGDQPTEGVVLRPLIEKPAANFDRMMAKHKRKEERETRTDFQPGDKIAVYEAAQAIAQEWVTEERLNHVIQKVCLDQTPTVKHFQSVINGVVDDVITEGGQMLVDTPEARRAIGGKAAKLFKARLGL